MTGSSGRSVVLAAVLVAVSWLTAPKALAQPTRVQYLPVAEDTEWVGVVVSPDGSRAYLAEYVNSISVIDTADDSLEARFELPSPEDEWIGGMAFSPDGRFVVSTDTAIYEIDPETGDMLAETVPPFSSWWEGPLVFTQDGSRAYLASVDEIFVLDLESFTVVDTTPDDAELGGLLAANPSWTDSWARAYDIAISPDDDRLYVLGEDSSEGDSPLQIVSGLTASSDFSALGLKVDPVPPPTVQSIASIAASGDLLFHSYGPVYRMSDGSSVHSGALGGIMEFDVALVAPTADGSRVYYQGWATDDRLTFDGESLLVANAATFEWMDVDGNADNGITGIDLPEAGGWNGGGSYNGRAMALVPDGTKAYVTAGGEGTLVADLTDLNVALRRVTPSRGGDDGDVTVVVSGSWPEGTSIALTGDAGPAVEGTDLVVLPNGALQARFDLREQPLGTYDVKLTPPDGSPELLEGAFSVEEAVEDATVDLLGDFNFLATGEARVEVVVENTGNVDLTDFTVTLGFDKGTRYKVELPSALPEGEAQTDEEYTTADDLGIEPIWLARLGPQRTYRFRVTLAGPSDRPPRDWDLSLAATVGYPAADEASEEGADLASSAIGGNGTAVARARLGIGDLCSALDALSTALSKAAKKAGNDMTAAQSREAMNQAMRDAAAQFAVAKVKDLLVKGITIAVASAFLPGVGPMLAAGMVADALTDLKSCYDFMSKKSALSALFSFDPNDKLSSTGLDGFIEGTETLRYRIRFENESDASAAAEVVMIRDELDDHLDLTTFHVVGSSHDEVLSYRLDEEARSAEFVFQGIDLPPNADPPEGQGWLEFEVRPVPELEDGTVIRNSAEIVFDLNDPIVTPQVRREVDLRAPSSTLKSLPATVSSSNIELTWDAEDRGVGVWDYTVYVATEDGEFEPWLEQFANTTATYEGEPDRRYRFSVVARDLLGNAEALDEDEAVETRTSARPGDAGCGCRLPPRRSTGGGAALAVATLLICTRRRSRRGLGPRR